MRRVICASIDHGPGVVHWGLNVSPAGWGGSPLTLPFSCHPQNWVGWITYADGTEERIQPGAFGEVTRLCVDDDGIVDVGEDLYEFDERPPTLDEWREQFDLAVRLYLLGHDIKRHASDVTWRKRRRYRREKWREFLLDTQLLSGGGWREDNPQAERAARGNRIDRARRFEEQRHKEVMARWLERRERLEREPRTPETSWASASGSFRCNETKTTRSTRTRTRRSGLSAPASCSALLVPTRCG